MGRQRNIRPINKTVVVIVDGEDEKWYLEKVREHYKPNVFKRVKIVPELAVKKKVKDLVEEARQKVLDGCHKVFLLLDFDDPLNHKEELSNFKVFYNDYTLANDSMQFESLSARRKKKLEWMQHLQLVVNSPCLEYWYLLHYRKTTKFYKTFNDLLPDLRKLPNFKEYVKDEKFYKSSPDIYQRLGGDEALSKARSNNSLFDWECCEEKGLSEMSLIFDFFDTL